MIDAKDHEYYPLNKHFLECYNFIQNAVLSNESILINCSAGVSRSVSIVIMYLMVKDNLSFDEAFKEIKKYRKQAYPN